MRDAPKMNTIKSDEKLLEIIEILKQMDGAGVTEVADKVGLAKSTVHGHLQTLKSQGFVYNDEGKYYLGIRFLDFGIYVRDQKEIFEPAIPKLTELAEETQETARLIVEENGVGTFIASRSGKYAVNTDARLGKRMQLHCVSGGKAILAHMPKSRVETIINRYGLPQRTEYTITDEDRLFDELAKIREEGLAYNWQESIQGIHAVGTPVLKNDTVIGAISVSGAANRMTKERCKEEIGNQLLAVANEIELDLTYQ